MRPILLVLTLAAALVATAPWTEAAANQISVGQSCSGGRVNVSFGWQNVDAGAQQQWLDLSLQSNGWLPGTFIGAGPLSGSAAGYNWDGLLPASRHYVRINQQLASGAWDASETFEFTTIGCATAAAASPAPTTSLSDSFTLLGFSDHLSAAGGLPEDLVAAGGTLKACNPQVLYAFVRAGQRSAPTDVVITWYANGGVISLESKPISIPARAGTIPLGLRNNTTSQTPDSQYTIKAMSTSNVVLVDAGFKLSCGG